MAGMSREEFYEYHPYRFDSFKVEMEYAGRLSPIEFSPGGERNCGRGVNRRLYNKLSG